MFKVSLGKPVFVPLLTTWVLELIFSLGSSLLSVQSAMAGVDFTRFLVSGDIQINVQDDRAQILSSGTDEKYLGHDAFGNIYKVRLKNALPLYSEVGVSILGSAMGLPSLPVYPILLKRGLNGLPTSQEARLLAPTNGKMGLAGKEGGYFQATVQPLAKLKPFDWKGLDENQLAELMGTLILMGIVGNHDIQLSADSGGNIGMAVDAGGKGHFVTLDATQAFKFVGKSRHGLKDFLDEIPPEARNPRLLGSSKFLDSLNHFISRLERIPELKLAEVFAPYEKALNSLRSSKGELPIDIASEIRAPLKGLRSTIASWLVDNGVSAQAAAPIHEPVDVPVPHIKIPTESMDFNRIPGVEGAGAKEALWAFWFKDFWRMRAKALEQWQQELGEEDVIQTIMKMAQESDSHIYFVADGLTIPSTKEIGSPLSQLSLNPHNKDLLFVVSPNDREAIFIERIARAAGAHTLDLKARHGDKLTGAWAEKVIQEARRVGAKRIAIEELPGETTETEEKIRQAGFELFIIDHHAYRGGIDRTTRLSSLEQAAELLGHELNGLEKAVGVNDRSFTYGLGELGLDKANLIRFIENYADGEAARIFALADRLKSEPTVTVTLPSGNAERVYILDKNYGSIPEVAGALAIVEYPHVVNVIMLSHDIRFSGVPELVNLLDEQFKPHENKVEAHYRGGDKRRSMFWGLKGIPAGFLAQAYKLAYQVVSGGDSAGCDSPFLKLERLMDGGSESGSHAQ